MALLTTSIMSFFGLVCLQPVLSYDIRANTSFQKHIGDAPGGQIYVEDIPFWPMFYPEVCNPLVNYSNKTNKTAPPRGCSYTEEQKKCNCETAFGYWNYTNETDQTNSVRVEKDAIIDNYTVRTCNNLSELNPNTSLFEWFLNCTNYTIINNTEAVNETNMVTTTHYYKTAVGYEYKSETCECYMENVTIDNCPIIYDNITNTSNATLSPTSIPTVFPTMMPTGPTPSPTCFYYNVSVPYTTNATNFTNSQNLTYNVTIEDCGPTPEPTPGPTVMPSLVWYDNMTVPTLQPTLTQTCYALCKAPAYNFGVSKWDGYNCHPGSQNVTEGTDCSVVSLPGYICEQPGMCSFDHTFQNQKPMCRVEMLLQLTNADYSCFTTTSDVTMAMTRGTIQNLTIDYYKDEFGITLSMENIKVDFYEMGYFEAALLARDGTVNLSEVRVTQGYQDGHTHYNDYMAQMTAGRRVQASSGTPYIEAVVSVFSPDELTDVLPGVLAMTDDTKFLRSVRKGLSDMFLTCMLDLGKVYAMPSASLKARDCVGTWQRWRPCDKTCGAGMKRRSYRVIHQGYLGGRKCNASKPTEKCWAGPCPTPEPTTMSPTPKPTMAPTPEPACKSLSGKSNQQCVSKCNDATSCPFTCRLCNAECACTMAAIEAKAAFRAEKKETRFNHRKFGQPTATPTPPPTLQPCKSSDVCDRTSFCWSGSCHNTRDETVCMKMAGTPTDDGWDWFAIAKDPNFMCEVEDDYDNMASRPKMKKNLRKEHYRRNYKWPKEGLAGYPRANMKQWFQQRADEKRELPKAVAKYQERYIDPKLYAQGKREPNGEAPYFMPGPDAVYGHGGHSHSTVISENAYNPDVYGHMTPGHAPGNGGRRMSAEVVDGALAKSPAVAMLVALSLMFM